MWLELELFFYLLLIKPILNDHLCDVWNVSWNRSFKIKRLNMLLAGIWTIDCNNHCCVTKCSNLHCFPAENTQLSLSHTFSRNQEARNIFRGWCGSGSLMRMQWSCWLRLYFLKTWLRLKDLLKKKKKEMYLMYNIVFISGVPHSDSAFTYIGKWSH